jgi:hypothetical protein
MMRRRIHVSYEEEDTWYSTTAKSSSDAWMAF